MAGFGLLLFPFAAQVQLAAPSPAAVTKMPAAHPVKAPAADVRVDRLSHFFASLRCPVLPLAGDFVKAADDNHIDWRLLPSISVIESGGGKVYRNNNIFGWSNGNVLFSSIRHSIHEIAFKLGRSPLYSRQDTAGKLKIYNSDQDYVDSVLEVMNRISPTRDLKGTRQSD